MGWCHVISRYPSTNCSCLQGYSYTLLSSFFLHTCGTQTFRNPSHLHHEDVTSVSVLPSGRSCLSNEYAQIHPSTSIDLVGRYTTTFLFLCVPWHLALIWGCFCPSHKAQQTDLAHYQTSFPWGRRTSLYFHHDITFQASLILLLYEVFLVHSVAFAAAISILYVFRPAVEDRHGLHIHFNQLRSGSDFSWWVFSYPPRLSVDIFRPCLLSFWRRKVGMSGARV